MQDRSNYLSLDPSARAGNRKIKSLRAVVAMVAAAALAACTSPVSNGEATPRPTRPAITTSATPEATTSLEEAIAKENEKVKAEAQATAEDFAARIIAEYKRHKSDHNFIYESKDHYNGTAVNVLYKAPTLLGGAHGEYGLAANVRRNAKGKLDPKTVDNIMLVANVNVAGREVASQPGDRQNIYAFVLSKDSSGDWSLGVRSLVKGGGYELRYDTGRTTADQYNTPLSVPQFNGFIDQANIMFDRTVRQTPVTYAPLAEI